MSLFTRTDVTLTLDQESIVSGQPLHVHATFGPADSKTQDAKVELLYRNTYKHDVTHNTSDTTVRTATNTADVPVAVQHVELAEGGQDTSVDFTFEVPEDAPATLHDVVEWQVRAVVDRKHAHDHHATKQLTVRTTATTLAEWAQSPAEPSEDWPLELEASPRVVRPGDRITGTFTFTPAEEIKVSEVRIQLRRRRQDQGSNFKSNDKVRVQLMGKTHLPAGQTQRLPFEITVPTDAEPSFSAEFNHQNWWVEGVLARAHAQDPHVSVQIVVHNA